MSDIPGSNFFDVEAPPPLDKFEGNKHIAPHNEVILSHMENARILSRRGERKARKYLRAIEARLRLEPGFWKRLYHKWLGTTPVLRDVDLMIAERERLRNEYKQQYATYIELKDKHSKAHAEDKHLYLQAGQVAKLNMDDIRDDLNIIQRQLEPLRDDIIRRNIIRKRLEEHRIALQDKKLQQRLEKQMEKEAAYFGEIMIRTFQQLGHCYKYSIWRGGRQKQKVHNVEWERVVVTPDSVQFKVFVSKMGLIRGTISKLPPGVSTHDLAEDRTIQQLSVACERPVRCLSRDRDKWMNGLWYEIDRLGVVDGLVDNIMYKTIMAAYPANEREKLPLLLGIKKGRYINRINLAHEPHFLIAGTTGSGKTVTYHGIICTLIQNYSPSEVRLLFLDLKEGVAFKKYSRVPHIIGDVIQHEKDVPDVLEKLEALRRWRMHKLSGVAEDINEYNKMVSPDSRMSHIVVCFDEYGALKDSNFDSDSYHWTKQLAMKGRAAGIHLIIGAQTPYVSDVPNVVKANMTFSLVGKQKTRGASMSATGDSQAYDLPNIPGRMVCDAPKGNFQVQLPMVTPEDIEQAIQAAEQWPEPGNIFEPLQNLDYSLIDMPDDSEIGPVWNIERLIDICLNERDGKISGYGVHEFIKHEGISRNDAIRLCDELTQYEHVVYCGNVYAIKRWKGGGYIIEPDLSTPQDAAMPVYGEIAREVNSEPNKEVA